MKDNGSGTSEMISRNWVLKRKRRKLPYNTDTSNGNKDNSVTSDSQTNTSLKHRIINEITSDDSDSKKKGNDGYYYECVICDLGGNLLCCDSCPRTYHLQCLDPPLKRIPMGKWKCPKCVIESDSLETVNNLSPNSKQARTSIAIGKSKSGSKSDGTDKVSLNLGKKKVVGKGISSSSPQLPSVGKRSDSSCIDGCAEGSLVIVNVDNEKKLESSPTDTLEETKSISPVKDVSSPSSIMDLKTNEETSENKHLIELDVAIQKPRKRKHKVHSDDGQKKPRTDRVKFAADTLRKKSKTKSARTGTSKLNGKRKTAENGASASLLKNKTRDIRSKDETVSEDTADQSRELHKTKKNLVETLTCEYQVSGEVQQVDRVLGCRVSVEYPSCDTALDEGAVKNCTDGAQYVLNHSNGEKLIENDMEGEKINVYRTSMTKECRVNALDLLEQNITGSSSAIVNGENQDNSTPSTEDLAGTIENIATVQKIDFDLNGKNKKSILAESPPSNGVTVFYEFLVKWVGKSHLHNSWISESHLKALAKRKLDNYKAKYGTAMINICEERWKIPQRVIALRSSTDGATEAFVKWTALAYDECTWERIDEPVMSKASNLIDLFNEFEKQTLKKDATKENTQKGKGEIVTLTEQPKEMVGGSLFPHQLEALNWLRKCWHKSRNVILADEMGLGKTVSACAFISSLYFEFSARLPCLVLVPLSTMPNWMSEFALWAPNLNVVEYHGSAKARAVIRQYEWHASSPSGSNKYTESYKFHVLLTTYEMVLTDSTHLRGVPWEVLVVDEGHRLKNSSSKLFSLLNSFSFQHRVLLTGTPLQNNIGEMYNLLNFLQPASFPSLSSFEEKFNDLTTAEKVDELKKLVAPHMLRRLKKDAMQNIPPKTERMVPVELSSIQAEYYRAMLTKNYQILRNIGKGVPQQSMLNIVMQLRKVCNHPYLIPGTEPESGSVGFLHEMRIKASAKLNLLHSMLKSLNKEGHRVLIFSQMTKLLDILEDYLNVEFGPHTFERVDGSVSVTDRQTAIARFNQDKSRFVFLLSTRSCGLGINLATADTVIIYDSDFNPHADIQAMNRAHRIGQSNRLLVYRLVVRASVEERILQLAKKKLMLDQLFVNKSGSQKEVEDILRWGTEELFNDSTGENPSNKDEAVAEIEHKHKRRAGGLGDVYTDKCTDGSTKIVWDENAIHKLLDRSNLQSSSPDSAEGESENDMLGSVKSLEWNDEPTEEQGGTEALPVGTDDSCAQNSEKKEDNPGSVTKENEWDRLLRVRWEKYQNEEEASLGRGKRQRKAVSYREVFAARPNESLNENGADELEPEPEPEREYTPAGRALKTKFSKLRARQKERLAQRNAIKALGPIEGLRGSEPLPQLPSSYDQDGDKVTRSDQPVVEKLSTVGSEDNKLGQTLEAPKSETDSTLRLGKKLKHKSSSPMDLSLQPSGPYSTDNLLPVLGLCAPNASQMESSHRNISRSHKQSRQRVGPEFPFHMASCSGTSNEADVKGKKKVSNNFQLPDSPSEFLKQATKKNISDSNLPFNPQTLAIPQGNGSTDRLENLDATFSNFQEKMGLPRLPFDEKLLPKYPFLARNAHHPHADFFPGLLLGSRVGDLNDSIQEPPTMPLLQNLKFPHEYNPQEQEVVRLTTVSGQMGPTFSSFPESHRKVLENILMRTGPGSNNTQKKKLVKDIWSEDELDFLWIGVRRHGRGNWDTMLRDPRLKFSNFRTAEDLLARWEVEQLKILDGPTFQAKKPLRTPKSTKSPLFPDVSDGMMTRALHGSTFGGPLKFRTHLADIKLGFPDPALSLPHLQPSDQRGLHKERFPPIPFWIADSFRANFSGHTSAGPSDKPGTSSNAPTEQPLLQNSLGTISLGSGLNSLKEDEQNKSKSSQLPSFLVNSNFLRQSQNDMGIGESTGSAMVADSNKGQNGSSYSKAIDEVGESSSPKNKLPHWLREAVSVPTRSPDPGLPPTVPDPDPRQSLKKQQKSHLGSQSTVGTSCLPRIEPNFSPNMKNPPSSSSAHSKPHKKTNSELSPSPEVLRLVGSYAAPALWGPHAGEKREETESGDSSKTESDTIPPSRPHVIEVSSEGTVSDHHLSDNETLP